MTIELNWLKISIHVPLKSTKFFETSLYKYLTLALRPFESVTVKGANRDNLKIMPYFVQKGNRAFNFYLFFFVMSTGSRVTVTNANPAVL